MIKTQKTIFLSISLTRIAMFSVRPSEKHCQKSDVFTKTLKENSKTAEFNQFTKPQIPKVSPQSFSQFYKTKIEKKPNTWTKLIHILKHLKHSLGEVKNDSKFIVKLRFEKGQKNNFSLPELFLYDQAVSDIVKFLPYSVFITIPLAEFALPVYLWLFPRSTPTQFLLRSKIGEINSKKEKLQEKAQKKMWKHLKLCFPDLIDQLEQKISSYYKDPLDQRIVCEIQNLDKYIVNLLIDKYEEEYEVILAPYLNSISGKEQFLEFYFTDYIRGEFMAERLINLPVSMTNLVIRKVLYNNFKELSQFKISPKKGIFGFYKKWLLEYQIRRTIQRIDSEDNMIQSRINEIKGIDYESLYTMTKRRGLNLESDKVKRKYIEEEWIGKFKDLPFELKHWINVLRYQYNDIII